MPVRRPVRQLLGVVAVLVLVLGVGMVGAAEPELVADDLQLFQRNEARGDAPCGPGALLNLGLEAGSGEAGCGFIGGAPFGEIFAATGDTETFLDTFSTKTSEVAPFTLDASRAVTGQIAITPSGAGAGQITVDLRLTALAAVGNARTTLGEVTVEDIVVSIGTEILEYEFDLPDVVEGQSFRGATLEVYVRGIHANHGYNELNGASFLTLPVLVPAPSVTTE